MRVLTVGERSLPLEGPVGQKGIADSLRGGEPLEQEIRQKGLMRLNTSESWDMSPRGGP